MLEVVESTSDATEPLTEAERPLAQAGVSPFSINCSCILYLRETLGVNIHGDAKDVPVNVDEPFEGGVVKFKYSDVYHVARIKHVMIDRILVQESNFKKCTPTERIIMLDDPHIVGYYYKNPN